MCCRAIRACLRLGCLESLFWKNHTHLPADGSPRKPGAAEKCCIRAHECNHRFTFALAVIGIIFGIIYTALFIYLQLPWFAVALPILEVICSALVLVGNLEKRPWMYWPHFVWNFFLVVLFFLLVLVFLLGGLAYARHDDYAVRQAHGILPDASRAHVYLFFLVAVGALFFHAILAALYVAVSHRDYVFMRDYLVEQRYDARDGRVHPAPHKLRQLEVVPPAQFYRTDLAPFYAGGPPAYYDVMKPSMTTEDESRRAQGYRVHIVPIRIARSGGQSPDAGFHSRPSTASPQPTNVEWAAEGARSAPAAPTYPTPNAHFDSVRAGRAPSRAGRDAEKGQLGAPPPRATSTLKPRPSRDAQNARNRPRRHASAEGRRSERISPDGVYNIDHHFNDLDI